MTSTDHQPAQHDARDLHLRPTDARPSVEAMTSAQLLEEDEAITEWFTTIYAARAGSARLQQMPDQRAAAEELVSLARFARDMDLRHTHVQAEIRRRARLRFDAETSTPVRLTALALRRAYLTAAGTTSSSARVDAIWEELPDDEAHGWAAAASHALSSHGRARRAIITGTTP